MRPAICLQQFASVVYSVLVCFIDYNGSAHNWWKYKLVHFHKTKVHRILNRPGSKQRAFLVESNLFNLEQVQCQDSLILHR